MAEDNQSGRSGITPQQAAQLISDVRETRDTVLEIKGFCGPCRKQVEYLTTVIDGKDGDGLKTQVALISRAQEAHKKSSVRSEVRYVESETRYATMVEKQMTWSRRQIKAVIIALLSFVGMAAVYFFGG